jgi:soluble lytic murein transglycosylase-like protein
VRASLHPFLPPPVRARRPPMRRQTTPPPTAAGSLDRERRGLAGWRRHGLRAAPAVLLALALPASAQVLQIDADGGVQRVGGGWSSDRVEPPAPLAAAPALPARYRQAFAAAAADYGIGIELLQALAWSESGFDPAARSSAGAIGLMQLMPDTARALGVDPHDPQQNIRGGAAYLREQLDRFDGDLERALAAYNAGPAQVERHHGVPPFRETRAYVAANLDRLAAASLAAAPPASTGETR